MIPFNSSSKDPAFHDMFHDILEKNVSVFSHLVNASQNYLKAFSKYSNYFMIPYLIATSYFNQVEKQKLWSTSPLESVQSYMKLLAFNLDLIGRGVNSSMKAITHSGKMEMENAIAAVFNTLFCSEGEDIEGFLTRQSNMMDVMANQYPKAIQDIEPEFGFHFERKGSKKITETDRFILYQNYPNPFNPTTTIKFDLPKTSQVTLKVFNTLGEEVATLVSERLSAGSYSCEWDASNLASGIYPYRLQAGDYVETKKMIILK